MRSTYEEYPRSNSINMNMGLHRQNSLENTGKSSVYSPKADVQQSFKSAFAQRMAQDKKSFDRPITFLQS
jgi:hypothetical protein